MAVEGYCTQRSSGARKICPLCEKPHNARTEMCASCVRSRNELEKRIWGKNVAYKIATKYGSRKVKHRLSCRTLLAIKLTHNIDDVFGYIAANPGVLDEARNIDKGTRTLLKRQHKTHLIEDTVIKKNERLPSYLISLFGKDKRIIEVSGNRKNPHIKYICLRCDKTILTTLKDYLDNPSHDCDALKSSGEAIIEEFLKVHAIKYRTQRDTLKCINPDTGAVMPYDFELVDRKILVEVQGDQHRRYTPVFQRGYEEFEYQRKKDVIKRRYAESQGYTLIEVWYEDLTEERLGELLL